MLRCTIKCSSYTSCYGQFTNKDTIIIDFDHYYIIDILYTYLPILPNWYFYQMIALYKFHLCSPCVVFHIKAPRKGTYIIFHWNIRQHRGKFLVFFFLLMKTKTVPITVCTALIEWVLIIMKQEDDFQSEIE